jgi:hypothetical protein
VAVDTFLARLCALVPPVAAADRPRREREPELTVRDDRHAEPVEARCQSVAKTGSIAVRRGPIWSLALPL